jgi:hypothetical protein
VPALPRRSFDVADPERQYVILLSYLLLRHGWQITQFLLHTACMMVQLRRSKGLVGFSLHVELWAKWVWTPSA